ncbi:TPA: 50S ribosomal protein L19, partial [Patescibacteria group bacterium]|nr:50S ribosomal protein L19 [Patescibacteria group bacterium]
MANLAEPILNLFRKSSVPQISVGDVVRVHQKIREGDKERVQVFEGIVIAKHAKTSLDATFTVRKLASGVGV